MAKLSNFLQNKWYAHSKNIKITKYINKNVEKVVQIKETLQLNVTLTVVYF